MALMGVLRLPQRAVNAVAAAPIGGTVGEPVEPTEPTMPTNPAKPHLFVPTPPPAPTPFIPHQLHQLLVPHQATSTAQAITFLTISNEQKILPIANLVSSTSNYPLGIHMQPMLMQLPDLANSPAPVFYKPDNKINNKAMNVDFINNWEQLLTDGFEDAFPKSPCIVFGNNGGYERYWPLTTLTLPMVYKLVGRPKVV